MRSRGNFARHHNRPFQAFKGIECPLLTGFFFLTGAILKTTGLAAIALLPQAGVALGMGLVAHNAFPAAGEVILPCVVLATVIFELIGPFALRHALHRTTRAET